ncbi:MAG: indole-3-glycerol phosphate synthase TrpC [Treponema sp.]|jgi:indole-3-glycerol phosphate synthase|nr:indole-3-glycerol phosphate synthase TrpC [Treponema sp.]
MILDDIAAAARRRVERAKEAVPLEKIRETALDKAAAGKGTASNKGRGSGQGSVLDDGGRGGPDFPFERALAAPELSFICEVKKASPSKGLIAGDFPYRRIAVEYEEAGAAAISVLTEPEHFLGRDQYLRDIASEVKLPLLRKDFTVDPYQIYEAKLLGASAVLLICALLDTRALAEYIALAGYLGLSCLTEAHTKEEIQSALDAGARIIGINNRDLKTFQVDLGLTGRLRKFIPPGVTAVSESGIRSPADIRFLTEFEVDAALIGEALMRAADKKQFLAELRGLAYGTGTPAPGDGGSAREN